MPTVTSLNATDFGFTPTSANPSAALRSAIVAAIAQGRPLFIDPGTYTVGDVLVDGPLELYGVPGKVVLKFASGKNAILRALNFTSLRIAGVNFDGAGLTPVAAWTPSYAGLVIIQRTTTISKLRMEGCGFTNCPTGIGVIASKATAHISECDFSNLYWAAAGLDHDGFVFQANRLKTMKDNGVVAERGAGVAAAYTRVFGNVIDGVAVTDPASTGWQGNGVLLIRESNASVTQNEISNCAFSAARLNGCTRARVTENHCSQLGEVAIYVEGFSDGRQVANGGYDSLVANNVIYDAGVGVGVANANYSGRLVVVANNVFRKLTRKIAAGGTSAEYTSAGRGLGIEAVTLASGNLIEDAVIGINYNGAAYTTDGIIIGNLIRSTTRAMEVGTSSGSKDVLVADNLAAGFAAVGSGGGALRQVNAADVITGTTDLASFTESTGTANLRIEGVVSRQTL